MPRQRPLSFLMVLAQHPTSKTAPKPPLSIVTPPSLFAAAGMLHAYSAAGSRESGMVAALALDATLVLAKPRVVTGW